MSFENKCKRAHLVKILATTGTLLLAAMLHGCDKPGTGAVDPFEALEPSSDVRALGGRTGVRDWNALTDSVLWTYLVESDTVATVGLRSPGQEKGYDKGKLLITLLDWSHGVASVRAVPGARFIKADTLIPWVRVKLQSIESLALVRALPQVQYVEPAYVVSDHLWASDPGCAQEAWPSTVFSYWSSGDILPDIYPMLRIDRAWAYANGSGVWIGLTDTGADANLPELDWNFQSGGYAPPRTIWRTNTDGTNDQYNPPCTHGTRLAGVIAAPMNNSMIVGVAWAANLASVKHASQLFNVDAIDAQQGIRDAGNHGAKVINMSWQSVNAFNAVENEIEGWYYNQDVVFVAAAGTYHPCDLTSSNNVVFPAEMTEVLSVSPSGRDGSRPCSAGYGPQLDVITYQDQPTTGVGGAIVSVGESSHASALVAGIAALVRQRFPSLTNRQVYDRIINTSGGTCSMPFAWHRLVNAEAAVGGLCPSSDLAPDFIVWEQGEESRDVTVHVNVTGGNGPIEYRWSDGPPAPHSPGSQTSASATYTIPNVGYAYDLQVSVNVRDAGSTNPGRTVTDVIHVSGSPSPPCEPQPPEVICPP